MNYEIGDILESRLVDAKYVIMKITYSSTVVETIVGTPIPKKVNFELKIVALNSNGYCIWLIQSDLVFYNECKKEIIV